MKERDHRLSNIRAVSCMAVVILHTFFAFASMAGQGSVNYTVSFIVRNLMFWAVPCFVMVTGALLLNPHKRVGYGKVLTKYIPRMVVALVLFSGIFYAIDVACGFTDLSSGTVRDLLKALVTGQGLWSHMWYLYTMIALYLLIPILNPFLRLGRKTAAAAAVVLFIFLSVLPMLSSLLEISFSFYMPLHTIYPLFLLLGGVLGCDLQKGESAANVENTATAGNAANAESAATAESVAGSKSATNAGSAAGSGEDGVAETSGSRNGALAHGRTWGVLGVSVFAIGMVILTILYTRKDMPELKALVNDYSFPLTVIGAVGMFLLIRSFDRKSKVLEFIDQNSFGIYLLHMIPLKILVMKKVFDPFRVGIWVLIPVAVGVFLVALLVTFILRKIPVVRKLL